MYYTTEDRLKNLPISDLLRIYNSNKNYIFFDINIFNVGAVTKIVLTNDYEKYSNYIKNNWNGYDYIIEKSSEVFYTIEAILCEKFLNEDLNILSAYKLSQLKKIYKTNSNKY